MKIIQNRLIPIGREFLAINLFGVVFTKGPLSPTGRNHELIHTLQMREMGYIFFYILYLIEYLVRLIQTGTSIKAYYRISFEREAYTHQHDRVYSGHRRHYSGLRYLRS